MKAWHWLLIAGAVLLVWFFFRKSRAVTPARDGSVRQPAVQSSSGPQFTAGIAALAAPFATAYNNYQAQQQKPATPAAGSYVDFDTSILDQIPLG